VSDRAAAPPAAAPGLLHRVRLIPLAATALGVCILIGLGIWQVQRLAWKENLLARIAALQVAPPEPLGVVLNRIGGPNQGVRGEVDFVRVQADCPTVQQTPTIKLYALLGGVMGDRAITACPIHDGPWRSLLVDRGFLPASQAVPSAGPLDRPIIGVLRRPEARTWLTPSNAGSGEWRSRDVAGMAAALHAPDPAPVFLMLERPAAPAGGPVPAAIPTDIPNNHLGYALTWFGLAAGLVGVYVAGLAKARRERAG
jgi:surfeit locus 1 family protein